MQVFTRHPFSGKRQFNTRTARERDAWIETARMHASNGSFWRDRCTTRCERDSHTNVVRDDGSGLYCTCCGKVTA